MVDDLKMETKNRVLQTRNLPTLPTALDEVTKLIENPNSSTEQIAKAISYDQVLSAKVLKMVNSPIYGFPGRISTVQHALVLLGFNVIKGIIISTSVFDDIASSMVGLWEHSLGCAMACQSVAQVVGLDEPEEYSVAGLLHDLGKVVTAVQLPDVKDELLELVEREDITYLDAEKKLLGFNHERINCWVADHWNLPPPLKEAMTYHHRPAQSRLYPNYAAVVHIGDFLVRAYEFGSGGDDNVSRFDPMAMKILGLNTKGLEEVMDTLNDKFVDIADLSLG